MMGAYTFNMRGGVFCNAQTANVVLMALAFGKGEIANGVYYLIPISAYIAGAPSGASFFTLYIGEVQRSMLYL